MSLINLDKATIDYGSGPVLEEITFNLEHGDKIGLVGPNGEGKTTLLSIITGALKPHSGDVHKQRGLKIGFLTQEHRLVGNLSLFEAVFRSHPEIGALEERLAEISHDGLDDSNMDEYQSLENRLIQLDGYNFKSRIEAILNGLGFASNRLQTPIEKLSGGERNRAAIACLLLENPDILLLDEPTNHIDYDGLQWLAEYLENSQKTFVVVSHDRYFLDRVAKEIIEIRSGELTKFAGNYSFYEKERGRLDKDLLIKYEAQRAEILRVQDFIRKNMAGQKTKQAQSRRTMLSKLERITPPLKAGDIRIRFAKAIRGGDDVLHLDKLGMAFGERHLYENFNLFVRRGERIGIVGPNGCGKTTLISTIAGKTTPTSGKVRLGAGIKMSYYSQDFKEIDESNSAYEEIHSFDTMMTEETIRSSLALFSLYNDNIFRPLRTFSGGEIARVAILKMLLGESNLLLLDEPTNHLDIKSRITLEKALTKFEGTVIVVSHDRYFLQTIAQKIIAFEPHGIKTFDGGFEYYLERREIKRKNSTHTKLPAICPSSAHEKPATKTSAKSLFKMQKEHDEVESEISRIENEMTRVSELLSEDHVTSEWTRMSALLNEYENLSMRLEKLLHRWEQLEESLQI